MPTRSVVVTATSAAASVSETQRPCRVQVMRKRGSDVLIAAKRLSSPALRMRRNRYEPRRAAQTTTMPSSSQERASASAERSTATTMTVMYVRLPVRSKKRSVWRRYAGTNAIHWMTKASSTQSAKTGNPHTVEPP